VSDHESLTLDVRDGIAEICLVGPGKGNAMGPAFFAELPVVFADLDRDPEVRVVLVRGKEGIFTYGLDLRAMVGELMPHVAPGNLAAQRARLLEKIGELQKSTDCVASCKKPVIAAISGPCIGGGVDLAAACDIRLADRSARFSVREVKLAIVADLGSLSRLPRLIGQGHTRELAFTGRDIDADRALRIGLVNDVYADELALLEGARELACAIAANPPHVVSGIKQVLAYGDDKSVADGQRFVSVWNAAFLASNDLFEAISAFAERRAPRFDGK
jgi:enoyl-CoA hydratase